MNKKEWQRKKIITIEARQSLADFSDFQAQLFFNRGISSLAMAKDFLYGDYSVDKHDPFLLTNMKAAVGLIINKIKLGELIVIYGDYDADGVTSSAVLFETLKLLKGRVEVYIPDRVSEGYGLNKEALKEIEKMGASLVITVDNGIRSKEEVKFAQELGMQVIITDHHIPADDKDDWPATIIVNPWICPEAYPFSPLAGVGVAGKVATAVISETNLDVEMKVKLEERILDLVALGTIADCVPLNGENRLLVKKGLEVMNRRKRMGLNELMEVAKLDKSKTIDSWNIGFQLAPRLNAAGRLNHANASFELLTATEVTKARTLSSELNHNNSTRQQITDEMVNRAVADYEIGEGSNLIIALSPAGEIWNEGVIGLAAGRLVEKYYRPALVITGENGHFKGSGRSIKELNLIAALTEVGEYLVKFGGHKAACGFSIDGQENLHGFMRAISALVDSKLGGMILKPSLELDEEITLKEATEELIAEIEALAPFGEANPKPLLLTSNIKIVDILKMGSEAQHLKLRLQQNDSPLKTAIAFSAPSLWLDLRIGDIIDLVYYLEINDFNGKREPQLRIVDIKKI